MQFSKPMYIFIGYFVRLRNDFKAIAYHAVYDIRSVSPLDGEGVTQPLPRLQAKVLVYPRPSTTVVIALKSRKGKSPGLKARCICLISGA
jgi:hypothetical protein